MGRAPFLKNHVFYCMGKKSTQKHMSFPHAFMFHLPSRFGKMAGRFVDGSWIHSFIRFHSSTQTHAKNLWKFHPSHFFPILLVLFSPSRFPYLSIVFLNTHTQKPCFAFWIDKQARRFRFWDDISWSRSCKAQNFVIVVCVCIPWPL